MMKYFFATVLAVVVLNSAVAQAQSQAQSGSGGGFLFTGAIAINHGETEIGTTTSKTEWNSYDLGLGYVGGSGLYLGAQYNIFGSKSGSTTEDGHNLAAALGFFSRNGFFIKGQYILEAQYANLEEGSGVQADLGFLFGISRSFKLGAQMSYRSIEYKKDITNAAAPALKRTELSPAVILAIMF